MPSVRELSEQNQFSDIIRLLNAEIEAVSGSPAAAQLLCNRGLCHQRLNLNRKALKDYEAALQVQPSNVLALVRMGEVLQALKKPGDAMKQWEAALAAYTIGDDLSLLLEAQALLAGRPKEAAHAGNSFHNAAGQLQAAPAAPAAMLNGSIAPRPKEAVHSNGNAAGAHHGPAAPRPLAGQPSALVRAACLDPSTGVGIAVSHINEGRLQEALDILEHIIGSAGEGQHTMGAHIARGTARAMMRDLPGAVEDFTVTIRAVPTYGDAWMRRGQARAALGEDEDALVDLQRCLELTEGGEAHRQSEALLEIGKIHHKQRDYRRAARELLRATVLTPDSKQAWTFLGRCQVSMGDLRPGVASYERALALDPGDVDAWVHLAQARKEEGHVREAERAFARVRALDRDRSRMGQMLRMQAHMCQGLGQHVRAVQLLTEALEDAATPDATIECLFMRGACRHALGHTLEAVGDYERTFSLSAPDAGEEARARQFLAFYQREMALHAAQRAHTPAAHYCLDRDLHPMFKELWCKKMPPNAQLLAVYATQRLAREAAASPGPPRPPAAELAPLLCTADALGRLLQYRHQGFLANVRQQRSAGLAAIELAQAVRHLVGERRAGREVSVDGRGSSSSAQAHGFGWRDAMDLVVKWRQLSEPNDQVIWVDLLTKEEFEAGFGSHTPIFSGQTKCVRYHMNFGRGLALLKEVIAEEGRAYDAQNKAIPLAGEHKQAQVAEASSAEAMWQAIGADSWVVVPIASTARPGHTMEGTRLTLVRMPGQPDSYEFSIKTPVTPVRWADYDAELSALWERVLGALEGGRAPDLARATLAFAYTWYNFMPLARGTAAAGYVAILGLFAAAGAPVSAPCPKAYQVDWEAILSRSAEPFIASVSAWLSPPAARGDPAAAAADAGAGAGAAASARQQHAPGANLEALPLVKDVLATGRQRLDALNALLDA